MRTSTSWLALDPGPHVNQVRPDLEGVDVGEGIGGRSGWGRAGPCMDQPREGVRTRIRHLGWILLPSPGPVSPTQADQSYTSYFDAVALSSPTGVLSCCSGKGTNSLLGVAPQSPPNQVWMWHRLASLPSPALVRIGQCGFHILCLWLEAICMSYICCTSWDFFIVSGLEIVLTCLQKSWTQVLLLSYTDHIVSVKLLPLVHNAFDNGRNRNRIWGMTPPSSVAVCHLIKEKNMVTFQNLQQLTYALEAGFVCLFIGPQTPCTAVNYSSCKGKTRPITSFLSPVFTL